MKYRNTMCDFLCACNGTVVLYVTVSEIITYELSSVLEFNLDQF